MKNSVKKFFYNLKRCQSYPDETLAIVNTKPLDGCNYDVLVNDHDTRTFYDYLVDVRAKLLSRRTSHFIKYLELKSVEQKCTLNEFLGVIIKQVNYVHERELSNTRDKLVGSSCTPPHMNMDKASHLKNNIEMGRSD